MHRFYFVKDLWVFDAAITIHQNMIFIYSMGRSRLTHKVPFITIS